jgi:mannitol-1-/sugar-/sorbitol-6-phosphatase
MASGCQADRYRTVAVSGVAGSGKSTLGRGVAAALKLPLLDLDTLTNPLLDRLQDGRDHWLAAPQAAPIREARYAALLAVAREVVATAGGAVLVAPFTVELRGGPQWQALVEAVAPTPLRLLHLHGDPELFAARRAHRGEPRDAHRPPDATPVRPAVPHVGIDAELTGDQQLFRALRAVGHRIPISADAPVFGADFDAVLFDLDGVLVDSTASVTRSWNRFAREFGVPLEALQTNHGRPARVLVERMLGTDRLAEGLARIVELEVEDASSVDVVPGAREFFAGVPEHRRAIVTSGTPSIATARLRAAGIPVPHTLVTADDVQHAKPDPEPYLLAARRLGVSPQRCLVVEDAPAGIAAARAAGCRVLGVQGTAPALAGAETEVDGLDRVAVRADGTGVRLTLTGAG